ncbi:MAG: response regulator [Corallococcus sp.]|nr:response regulator [Corallococcus sp.]
MKKKTQLFLNISLILIAVLCIIIFSVQLALMNRMGGNAISELGTYYMTDISEQVASHFGTVIELRLSQVESLVHSVPPGRVTNRTFMRVELSQNARSMDFDYLALYRKDGNEYKFEMIYGAAIEADVPDDLYESVQGGQYNVCAGKDKNNVPLALFGVPASYPMDDDETSIALVAGFPTKYLGDTLENNIQSQSLEYMIFRTDGSYVLRSDDIAEDNYFDRIKNAYETYNGKTAEQYAEQLQNAMKAGLDYNDQVMIDGERWTVHCTNLPNSRWHLLVKTSHGYVDDAVNALQIRWFTITLSGCIIIVAAILAVFILYIIGARKQMHALDDARKAAERSNAAKNEFLSNMSHDIRTPMNGIMGMTNIAIGNIDNPPRVLSCLKKIHVSSRHLLGLISDMLDMAKVESGSLILNIEPLSLREIIQNVATIIELQVQEKNQNFNVYLHDIYHENVCADRVRLNQILLNILGNAIKFTPEGGNIRVDLYEEPSPKGPEYISSILCVQDDGIGMSAEFKERIFDAFAREDNARVEKAAGGGMGLTITKSIVDAMGGTITVESEKGKGSTFRVVVDMETTASQEKELTLASNSVLVLDGDTTAAALAVEALESMGLTAQSCAELAQAFDMIEDKNNSGTPYALALVDWNITDSDGEVATKKLAQKFGDSLPVVMLTVGEMDELEAKREELGVKDFIRKPLFRSSLYYGLRPILQAQTVSFRSEEKQKTVSDDVDLHGKRVLIAEDNDLNWEIASELVEELGMKAEWAENGQICVDKFAASEPNCYDVILMDLRMPIMMGFEAARAIRQLERDDAKTVPIIAVSADTFADDVAKCYDSGMNAHIAKPLDLDRLLDLLKKYLG